MTDAACDACGYVTDDTAPTTDRAALWVSLDRAEAADGSGVMCLTASSFRELLDAIANLTIERDEARADLRLAIEQGDRYLADDHAPVGDRGVRGG
jgi:hypothetical protein